MRGSPELGVLGQASALFSGLCNAVGMAHSLLPRAASAGGLSVMEANMGHQRKV